MSNNIYLDLHVLQTVPPSCVNRDDSGSPKTATYGGVNRARVSSQAWKHAMREMFKNLFEEEEIGYRTKRVRELLMAQLRRLAPEKEESDVAAIADMALEKLGIKNGEDKSDVLFFISSLQVKALAEISLEYVEDVASKKEKEEKYKNAFGETLKNYPSIDIVLFGRMAASAPELNVDATAQVAHSISTHEVSNEYDYFTAVDDCCEKDQTGAGHLGTVEFNSSTLYRYATVNVTELYGSKLKTEEVYDAVRGFIEAFIRSMPTGKQNTFANRTLPYFTYVTLRDDQPVNMSGAFERPVNKGRDGYERRSAEAFVSYVNKVYENYADKPMKSWVVCLDDTEIEAERVKLSELYDAVTNEVIVLR